MRQRLAFGVPILAAALLLAAGCESSNTELFDLSGQITDDRSGAPIDGATVTFTADTGYSASTTSDGEGYYRIAVETDQPFGQVRAERDGYVPKEATVYFDSDSRRIDLQLRAARGE